uniref:Rho-GAP domain-containing protein n=1 Tax=Acrobeloides nanus TaxID=290746 RepID=A0A914C9A1_9BILA
MQFSTYVSLREIIIYIEQVTQSKMGTSDVGNFRPTLSISLKQAVINSKCFDGVPVPLIVRQCIDYVEEEGLLAEGIYRVSSPITRLDELERMANHSTPITYINGNNEKRVRIWRFIMQM